MKKLTVYGCFLAVAGLLFLTSCSGPATPSRKKMPNITAEGNDFSNMHLFQSSPGLEPEGPDAPFSTRFTSVDFNGGARECVSVALPESADGQALALIGLYKPFAPTLVSQWARQQNNGVVLDFSDGSDQKRSDFLMESKGNPDIPVIILWNERSSKRVAAYLGEVTGVPGIALKTLSK